MSQVKYGITLRSSGLLRSAAPQLHVGRLLSMASRNANQIAVNVSINALMAQTHPIVLKWKPKLRMAAIIQSTEITSSLMLRVHAFLPRRSNLTVKRDCPPASSFSVCDCSIFIAPFIVHRAYSPLTHTLYAYFSSFTVGISIQSDQSWEVYHLVLCCNFFPISLCPSIADFLAQAASNNVL